MGRYSKDIERRFTIVSVSGDEVLVLCTSHADTTGKMYVNSVNGLYHCKSCDAKGSLAKTEGVFLEPLKTADLREKLAEKSRRKQPQKFLPEGLLKQYDMPTDYWTGERGLDAETVELLRLGYDPFSDRATLPLRDMYGRILGTTFRSLDGSMPKYRHPKGFPTGKHLYAGWLVEDETTVAVMEGQVDAARGWQHGVPSVATMGSRVTRDQVRVFQQLGIRRVVMMYDNDSAGKMGVMHAWEAFRGSGVIFKAGWYRPNWVETWEDGTEHKLKDPDSLSRKRMNLMFNTALPILDWHAKSFPQNKSEVA